ncbi:MAG: hypothetical protein ACLQDL_12725 [Spirochaetia bacterium]
MSIFEIIMLVCFGAAWPVSIYKSLKTRAVAGKSLFFLIIILVGYMAGVLHKIIFHYDLVIFLYALNAVMVGLDIALYLRNRLYHVRKSLADAGQPEGRGEAAR